MCEREREARAYERNMIVFALKKADWKQERKKLKEEVRRLRKVVEEKDERVRALEIRSKLGAESEKRDEFLGTTGFLVEQMREERVWRDEAVDKWKKLYLAIKAELDDLIQKANHGDGLYGRAEGEELIEELKMEVKAKEGCIDDLKAQLASSKKEEYNRAREVDILRQSLKIMSSRKAPIFAPSKPKLELVKQATKAETILKY
ncbi:GOLGIN FAMILY A PROTEIN [Salix koriyanagi]|uniref:GOLGIN FAMILY A PROTEIN n=1 Tax=Salix koriyanagi TaxID=2511006 RepID=A0A9Q0WLD7_9ROSI|nr:GOLGIN FAMILY A PROTEIN [Salix koriyanagi]